MHLNQVVILLVAQLIISAPVTFGIETISTTTERDVNNANRYQQKVVKIILGNNLEEQQNFCINFDNNSYELQSQKQLEETRKEIVELFDKKLEVNAQFREKQNELINIVNKTNDLLQQFVQKIEAKFANVQEEIENITSNLGKVEHGKTGLPKSCREILRKGDILFDGIYDIQPSTHSPSFKVQCDMQTRGGGWTYVLNRFDGSQDFYLDWKHYKNGFGNLNGEFWVGLEHLYELTGFQDNHLLIEIVDWDSKHSYTTYSAFRIGSEQEGYPIKVIDGFDGAIGEPFKYQKNMKFSTYDRDQDELADFNCADYYHGAGWYKDRTLFNFAGTYFNKSTYSDKGMFWYPFKMNTLTLKEVKIMVKPCCLS